MCACDTRAIFRAPFLYFDLVVIITVLVEDRMMVCVRSGRSERLLYIPHLYIEFFTKRLQQPHCSFAFCFVPSLFIFYSSPLVTSVSSQLSHRVPLREKTKAVIIWSVCVCVFFFNAQRVVTDDMNTSHLVLRLNSACRYCSHRLCLYSAP